LGLDMPLVHNHGIGMKPFIDLAGVENAEGHGCRQGISSRKGIDWADEVVVEDAVKQRVACAAGRRTLDFQVRAFEDAS